MGNSTLITIFFFPIGTISASNSSKTLGTMMKNNWTPTGMVFSIEKSNHTHLTLTSIVTITRNLTTTQESVDPLSTDVPQSSTLIQQSTDNSTRVLGTKAILKQKR